MVRVMFLEEKWPFEKPFVRLLVLDQDGIDALLPIRLAKY